MENLEKIEQYLDGEMNQEEIKAFEKEMGENADLAEEVSLMRLTRDAIKSAGIREIVTSHQQEYLSQRKPAARQISFNTRIIRIAASILVIFSFWGFYQIAQTNSESLRADYGISYRQPVLRSTEAEQKAFREQYKKGNFGQLLKDISTIKNPTAEQYFLTAMAAYELKDFNQSITLLKEASDVDSREIYENEISYYTGLSLIGQEKYKEAYDHLKAVKEDTENPYSKSISNGFLLKLRYLAFTKGD
ncbi:anti-sigma factor family protein [Jiulongibacter sediminis]|uniref:Tetratricopeptide repeat-like domain-containing protein n=1 Tax=Jiulongibacter sediminis TaxID=1605367 RepID=A0A0P7BU69_9BACT|nr:hypothetical protein [Jiulongibacter sediminis]KPM48246.1 hypothetical protein AFM12_06185 [Jiulongibacter sediminis]TBX24788.1 hypothetical protein TK44_06190 [Jiulongibacter sediminis]